MSNTLKGNCHCGSVKFEVTLHSPLEKGLRCNCSLCKRKGALMYAVPKSDLTVIEGKDKLSLYQWGSNRARHYFCQTCGIYTHHQRYANPEEYSFNLGCIDEVDVDVLSVDMIKGADF